MKKLSIQLAAMAAVALVVAGCNTKIEEGKHYAILKGGQQVSADMVGWVAVPNTAPVTKAEKDVKYAVVASHNVVPETLDGWVAINPGFFTKLSCINVEAPAVVSVQKWVLKPEGKSVPKDKNGWIALPYSEPQIEKSDYKKDREMASLTVGNIIPKEMNGWVAVDRETLAKLVTAYMNTGPGSKSAKGE